MARPQLAPARPPRPPPAAGRDGGDAWHLTALHHAAAAGAPPARLAALLDGGAAIDAVGAFGSTPRALARWAGRPATERYLAGRGGGLAVGPLDEPSRRCLLAGALGLGGSTVYRGHRLPLTAALPHGTYAFLAASVEALPLAAAAGRADGWPAPLRAAVAAALRGATLTAPAAPPHEGPLLRCCEAHGHARCLALWGADAVLADRGWPPWRRGPWLALRLPDAEARQRCWAMGDGGAGRRGSWTQLWLRHGAGRQTPLRRALAAYAPHRQRRGRCVWASAKAGVYALLLLAQLRGALGVGGDALALYKIWTRHLRRFALGAYATAAAAGGGGADLALLQRGAARLRAREARRPAPACVGGPHEQ